MHKLDVLKPYAPILLRVGMSLVFLWFGYNQIAHPDNWLGIVPEWAAGMLGGAATVVMMNGWFEVIAGILLILGIGTRIVALLLALHLIGIASTFGLSSPTGVRDWGLCLATFAIFFRGADAWSLDRKWLNKTSQPSTS